MSRRDLTRAARILSLLSLLITFASAPAGAQLAQSFYNITGIETRALPNGVQVTIRTDGTVDWGVDRKEYLSLAPGADSGDPLALTSFRIRFIGARAQIPAYNDIGVYPVDAAVVTLGESPLTGSPVYSAGRDRSQSDPGIPRLDVTFRLFVPVRVSRLSFRYGSWYPWVTEPDRYIPPREAAIEPSPDRRSLVLTFIVDRADEYRPGAEMRRSPPEGQRHHLRIGGAGGPGSSLSVDALHAPLRDVLDGLSRAADVPLVTAGDAAAEDISLYLPVVPNVERVLGVLTAGYDLSATPRPADQGGGYTVGHVRTIERIPLKHLTPDEARQLLPDFLLPHLHADAEHDALVASGSPALIAKIRADLAVLDLPAPQVRIEARLYEIQSSREARRSLAASLAGGRVAFDTTAGTVSVALASGQSRATTAALEALVARGAARLMARPSLVLASGSPGTLFFGQTRFLTVLENDYGGQNVRVLPLPVGTSLAVTPTVCDGDENGAGSEILMDVAPQVATVDSVEAKTGLPTVGTREIHSVVRLRDGDTLLIAGLDSADAADTHRRLPWLGRLPWIGALFRGRDAAASGTLLAVLVTAHRIPVAGAIPPPPPPATPATRSSS